MHGCIRVIAGISILLVCGLQLSGCLTESKQAAESPDTAVDTSDDTSSLETYGDHALSGSVGDGPVVGAAMRVLARDGSLLMEFESDPSAGYEITVRAKGKFYPLQIHARNGVDLVTGIGPDFELIGIVPEPGKKSVANVNPYSTLTFQLAAGLPGGASKENVQYAEGVVVRAFAGGLSSIATTGPLSTVIGPDNVAEIVRASEELGESIRRTRDQLKAVGASADGDAVTAMLGADLVDETLDGRGGPRANERGSAISLFASGGVMLESMRMELRVYEVDATAAMNLSIARMFGSTRTSTIQDLTVTEGQLAAARKALAIAETLDLDPRAPALLSAVDNLRAGMGYTQARMNIPDTYRSVMRDLLVTVAAGDATLIEDINRLAAGEVPASSANQPPLISGTPPRTASVGSRYQFTPAATDPDADTLTFSARNLPAWATLNASSGMMSGTPADSDIGAYDGIEISVSDGEFSATLGPFSIQVNGVNAPPSISGQPPQSVVAGQTYTFTPVASDPDGDALSFSAQRLPAWLRIDSRTGRISGTPAPADIGSYDNIVLSVSDGVESSMLGPFAIEVTAAGSPTGSVTLSWTPPTQNTDGSTLTDLGGYRLYWSTSATSGNNSATISNPSVTTYVIENLVPGTYQIVATAFNSAGVESDSSNAVEVVVN